MPRRRMIDPLFWEDAHINQLTINERLMLLSCLNNSDDEGRILAHPAFLKSKAFLYDKGMTIEIVSRMRTSVLKKMDSWPAENMWLMILYRVSSEEYMYFPNWQDQQKPSHPVPSKIPAPKESINSRNTRESDASNSGRIQESFQNISHLGQSSQGQVSLVKDSVGKDRGLPLDFTNLLNSETDLTDYLTTILKKYSSRGPSWQTEILSTLWTQATGKPMEHAGFDYTFQAVKTYPPNILAKAYARAAKYKGGDLGSWKYLKAVLEEKAENATEK